MPSDGVIVQLHTVHRNVTRVLRPCSGPLLARARRMVGSEDEGHLVQLDRPHTDSAANSPAPLPTATFTQPYYYLLHSSNIGCIAIVQEVDFGVDIRFGVS